MDQVRVPTTQAAPIILDRCQRGHGLWFDTDELETILADQLAVDHPAIDRIRHHLTEFNDPTEVSEQD